MINPTMFAAGLLLGLLVTWINRYVTIENIEARAKKKTLWTMDYWQDHGVKGTASTPINNVCYSCHGLYNLDRIKYSEPGWIRIEPCRCLAPNSAIAEDLLHRLGPHSY